MATRETTLVFDIETVPDVEGGRRVYGLEALDHSAAAQAMSTLRLVEKGTDFQPLHLHRIVAISVALRHDEDFRVWSLGEADASEAELVQRFFDGIEKFRPTLVSWNGSGFDLPVLHYRALIHGIAAPAYWDTGHFERDAKWNNYLSRYQFRHTDLMDVLALYNSRAAAKLNEISLLLGFPGKLGMDGSKVAGTFAEGGISRIRDYCETDVLNTWLVYLRFQLMRGHLNSEEYADEIVRAREFIAASSATHWREFNEAWDSAGRV